MSPNDFDEAWNDVECAIDLNSTLGTDPAIDMDVFQSILEGFMTLTSEQKNVLVAKADTTALSVETKWAKSMARVYLRHSMKPSSGPTSTQPTLPTNPNMGEVVQQVTGTVIRMGGIPNKDWTGLDSKTDPSHGGQNRSLDKTKGQKRVAAIPRLKPKWQKADALYNLQKYLNDTLKDNGMEQCMYLPDIFDSTKMVNAVMNPSAFVSNPEHVETSLGTIKGQWDDWDKENDRAFRDILLESIHHTLKAKISLYHPNSEPTLKVWLRLVEKIKVLTPEAVETIILNKKPNNNSSGDIPRDNPSKKKNNSWQSPNGQASWKRVAPKPGASHEKTDKGGAKWYWCQKCNNGKGRWTASHKTDKHIDRRQFSGNKPKTNADKAAHFAADVDEPTGRVLYQN